LTQENTWHLVGKFHSLFSQHLCNVLTEALLKCTDCKNEKNHHLRGIPLELFTFFPITS